ncbi:uncharacterized protein BT62DRAFT_1008515 [Guyanagaster necrorhizus]|uniref:Uncharacterized protein n=1 Tax=Guyanagaster necrorhizus TaxID=856835 RepID=A0A9P7VNF7_9AGAR|nr:uncharacterized protein BT62DRAFT_1008515 [Guyanagaster necrorhizus MCA 3950]KAG7443852.1 hypothetical protein BT62DRAFT_1008515 [Guyanagaster necrorhizus MCA 3950]
MFYGMERVPPHPNTHHPCPVTNCSAFMLVDEFPAHYEAFHFLMNYMEYTVVIHEGKKPSSVIAIVVPLNVQKSQNVNERLRDPVATLYFLSPPWYTSATTRPDDPALEPPFSNLNITDAIVHLICYTTGLPHIRKLCLSDSSATAAKKWTPPANASLLDREIVSQGPWYESIRGLIFPQDGSAPIEVPLTFVFRHGEILDCIPQLNDFFPPDEHACRRVGGQRGDPPFEIWYYKNQMQLFFEDPNSVNDTIISLTGSREVQKICSERVVLREIFTRARLVQFCFPPWRSVANFDYLANSIHITSSSLTLHRNVRPENTLAAPSIESLQHIVYTDCAKSNI